MFDCLYRQNITNVRKGQYVYGYIRKFVFKDLRMRKQAIFYRP